MKTTSDGWYQVVFDPDDDRNLAAMMATAELVADKDGMAWSPWLRLRLAASELLHPLVHHYVPMKEWDEGSQRIIQTDLLTCLWCPKTYRE